MRVFAVMASLALALTTPAFAEPYTDYTARLALELPAEWSVAQTAPTRMPYVRASAGTNECHFVVVARPATQDAEPARVRLAGRELLAETVWARMPPALPRVFAPDATVTATHVDETPFWPIQFGTYASAGRTVHAAVQFRPGSEYWGFCLAREGEDAAATFEQILRSVASTEDTQLRAAIEAVETQQAASDDDEFRALRNQLDRERGNVALMQSSINGQMGGSGAPSSGGN